MTQCATLAVIAGSDLAVIAGSDRQSLRVTRCPITSGMTQCTPLPSMRQRPVAVRPPEPPDSEGEPSGRHLVFSSIRGEKEAFFHPGRLF